jgi:outer membrane murein-binding lipoprotein Lpp
MNQQEIRDSVPDDAPSSTTKPRNNLWTWVVGMFAVVIGVLWLQGIGTGRQVIKGKDETIQQLKEDKKQLQEDYRQSQSDLRACKDENTQITAAGKTELLEYLDIKPGKRQTISISPKQSTSNE